MDIIILNEMKMMGPSRGETMSGSEFNDLKNQIKAINPKAQVGIVESRIKWYSPWIDEGADPDIIGLEQYYDTDGKTGEPSYDDFMSQVATKFPRAKVQAWVNTPLQIENFIGKVYSIVLFGTDSYKIAVQDTGWPEFKLEDSQNELKAQYGTAQLVSSSAPASSYIGNNFEVSCDFGARLPCLYAKHNTNNCNFVRFDKTSEVFSCNAAQSGNWNDYCGMFTLSGDNRCFNQGTTIKNTEVKICPPENCANKQCGDNNCGGSCGSCSGNQDCDNSNGQCYCPWYKKIIFLC
jgi:hypothetical protein